MNSIVDMHPEMRAKILSGEERFEGWEWDRVLLMEIAARCPNISQGDLCNLAQTLDHRYGGSRKAVRKIRRGKVSFTKAKVQP